MNWTRSPYGNYFLRPDPHYFVSYNPQPIIGGEEGQETALVVESKDGTKYLILLGDWREQYEKAIEKDGLGACLALFEANKDKMGRWSNEV